MKNKSIPVLFAIILLSSTLVLSMTPKANALSIATDTIASTGGIDGGSGVDTLNMTIGNNANRVLFVAVTSAGPDVTFVKIGSTSFTQAVDQHTGSDGRVSTIWYLVNPPTGSQTITVSFTATGSGYTIGAYSLYNVNQVSPVGVTSKTSSGYPATGQPNGAITPTHAGSMILDSLQAQDFTSTPPTNSLTSGWAVSPQANNFGVSQYNASPTIGSSNSMSWSGLVGAYYWAWSAVEVLPFKSPLAPTLNNANTLSSSIQQLHWTASTGALWYLIDQESPTGHGFSQIVNSTNATTQWTLTGLIAGTQYNYKIYAGNGSGTSSNASNTKANYTTNVTPTGLSFTNVGNTSFRISWINPTGNFSGFKIEKESPVGGGWNTVISNTNNSTNHYDFTGLNAGTQYNVRISTNYATGSAQAATSSPSNSVSTFTFGGSSAVGAEGYFKSGRWYSSNTYSAIAPTTQEASTNMLRAFPFIVGKSLTADRIQFEVVSAISSANCNVGIYNSNSTSLYPTTLLVDGGSKSVNSTGLKTTTINSTLAANNLYWLAYNCNGTPTLSAIPASGIPDVLGYSGVSGLGTQGTGWTVPKTYNGTLPSTYPVDGTILSNVNGMLIQVRAK